ALAKRLHRLLPTEGVTLLDLGPGIPNLLTPKSCPKTKIIWTLSINWSVTRFRGYIEARFEGIKNIRAAQSRLRMSNMSGASKLYGRGGTSSYGRMMYFEEAARKLVLSPPSFLHSIRKLIALISNSSLLEPRNTTHPSSLRFPYPIAPSPTKLSCALRRTDAKHRNEETVVFLKTVGR
ncbi:LOW QUALITY PROTEIN: hypothetical protein ACHAW6_009796, partial [Cyclotella cf. meneghiniana]